MSIDRYLTVVHELWYRKYRKPKIAIVICFLIWAGKIVMIILASTEQKGYILSHSSKWCLDNSIKILFSSFWGIYVPL